MQNHVHPKDLPLLNRDLALVQQGFDAVRAETGAKASYQYSDVIASTLVHFYKQGFEKKCVYLCSRRRYRARFSGVNDLCRLEVRRPSRRL